MVAASVEVYLAVSLKVRCIRSHFHTIRMMNPENSYLKFKVSKGEDVGEFVYSYVNVSVIGKKTKIRPPAFLPLCLVT